MTENSLREEINTLVTSALLRQVDVRDPESDFYTNEIISTIEKRIDQLIQHPKSLALGDDKDTRVFNQGIVIGLELIKEMLLK